MSQALRPVLHRNVASWNKIFATFLPEIVVKVTHLTVEAFVLLGPSEARIAESVKLSSNRLASEAHHELTDFLGRISVEDEKMFKRRERLCYYKIIHPNLR